jgi:WD40 repeat protein
MVKIGGKEGDLQAHKNAIADLAFTPDKKNLVTADFTGEIKVWDLMKGAATATIAGKGKSVVLMSMSPDGKRFAVATEDNIIRVYDLAGKELRSWDLQVPGIKNRPFVRGMVFTADGKSLATANANTTAYLLECP